MTPPALLLGAATLFWGAQTGFLLPAAAVAAALEARGAVRRRWAVATGDFGRISDVSSALFFLLLVFLYSTRDAGDARQALVACVPMALVPLLVAQLFSEGGRIGLPALFVFLRRRNDAWSRASADLSWPYLILCVLCAGSANARTPAYYAGVVVLTTWGLWGAKPAGRSRAAWLAALAVAAAAGWAAQLGLHRLQAVVEASLVRAVFGVGQVRRDALESRTAMGHVGALKQSDRVVVRLWTDGVPPPLLRFAAYDSYAWGVWRAKAAPLREAAPGKGEGSWVLGTGTASGAATMSQDLEAGTGLLALPPGTLSLEGLPAASVRRSGLGAVRVEGGPGLAVTRLSYAADAVADAPPGAMDLDVPRELRAGLEGLAAALGMDATRPRESLRLAARYFQDGFKYSLTGRPVEGEPVADFLFHSKTGHCEHFASATVLLLRAAGIPARYATGFALQEQSRLEGAYVARGRHAHAWTEAYVDGRWTDLDTTPVSSWEEQSAPWWRPFADLASWAGFRFQRWRWKGPSSKERRWPLWTAGALVVYLAWRVLKDLRRAGAGASDAAPAGPRPGADSEFYAVEAAFARRGLGRRAEETAAAWAERVSPGTAALRELVSLHERYRFDPVGLDAEARTRLRRGATDALRVLAR